MQQAHISTFKAIQKGDKKAFDTFFIKYYPILCGYATHFVGKSYGEEITQEVMIWLWENRENIVIESSLLQYLFRAVRNRCINFIHKIRIREEVHLKIADSLRNSFENPDFYAVEELTEKIEEILNRLPDTHRETFVLNRMAGKTYKEIALQLQVSTKTIDYRIQQVLKVLRIQLKEYFP